MGILHRVQARLRQRALLPAGAHVVVGVSGGLDSVTLLHLLHRLAPRWGWALHVATLDHGLRGAVGAQDVAFVVALCAAWGLTVTHGRADVAALRRTQRLGIEAAARLARYDFLGQVAQQQGASYVAVAHHRDDQAETVLLRLARGSGTRGLGGMAWQAPLPGQPTLTLVRPLLAEPRAALEAYAQDHDLTWRHDTTNDDTAHRRNHVRHVVMPTLRAINPDVGAVLAQAAHVLADDEAYLHSVAVGAAAALAHVQATGIDAQRGAFAALPVALQRRVLRLWVHQVNPQAALTFVTLDAALHTALHAPVGTVAELPGHVLVRVSGPDRLTVAPALAATTQDITLPPGFEVVVPVPGRVTTPGGWSLVTAIHVPGRVGEHVGLAADAPLSVLRARRPGDRFAPPGLGGRTQKLGAWMTAQRVPVALRDAWPVLAVQGQARILAVWHDGRWVCAWFDDSQVRNTVALRLETVVTAPGSVDTRPS